MFIYFFSFLLLQYSALPLIRLADINKAKMDEEKIYSGLHIPVMTGQNIVVADSSVSQFSMWTQMQECLAYNPVLGYLQFVCRNFVVGGALDVWQSDKTFSVQVLDLNFYAMQLGPARYPTSVASGNAAGENGPHIAFTFLITGSWGGMGGQRGSWFGPSPFYSQPVDLGPGDVRTHKNIGKQLHDDNLLFIGVTVDYKIIYRTWSPALDSQLARGVVAPETSYYWGFDINGGIGYVFWSDPNLNLYYKTTTDGINWSPIQTYNIIWPQPFTNNVIHWKQMAVTDAGNPILVFDITNGDDTEYPYEGKVYVSTAPGQPCIEVGITTQGAECFYPTIATGGNYVVVLFGEARSGTDTTTFWDIYYNYSPDNGLSWSTPRSLTSGVTDRNSCLWQIAKRLDAVGAGQFFYAFGCAITDPLRDLYALVMNNVSAPSRWYVGRHPVLGIAENKTERPKRVILEVSTNPVIARAVISYTIPFASNVLLRLFSIDGRLIKTIDKGHRPGGKYTHKVDTSEFSNGIYIVILETDQGNATEKVIIIH